MSEENNSVDQQTLTIQQAIDLGVEHHNAGNLAKAESIFQQIVKTDANQPVALNMLGVIAHQLGKIDMAVNFITRALDASPDYDWAHYNLGLVFKKRGQLDEAIAQYRMAIHIKPDFGEAHTDLGLALQELGQLDEAVIHYHKAIGFMPGYVLAHNNLGVLLQNIGQLDEAVVHYQKAISINPDFADAHNNLGVALHKIGRLDEALEAAGRAVALKPQDHAYLSNASMVYCAAGRFQEAIDFIGEALRCSPTDITNYWGLFAECLYQADVLSLNQRLLEDLSTYLGMDIVEPKKIRTVVQNILRQDEALNNLQSFADPNDVRPMIDQLTNGDALRILSNPLIIRFIPGSKVTCPDLENLFGTSRKALLQLASENRLHEIITSKNGMAFISALSQHCFLNEYVYNVTEEETIHFKNIEQEIARSLENGGDFDVSSLVLLTCYHPLFKLTFTDHGFIQERMNMHPELAMTLRQQLTDPLDRERIGHEITQLTKITDSISQSVKNQYEENPYPVWRDQGAVSSRTMKENLLLQFPHLQHDNIGFAENPEILCAGCGTGYQPILTARLNRNARVKGVDLSLTSLSYAEQKRRELKVENLQFFQADLLGLNDWQERFDLVQCSGVLHHMEAPLAGWKVLLGLLKPNGFMQIGLYSEIARQTVVRAREFIADKGYPATLNGIRQCRHDIQNLADNDPVKVISYSSDFYSVSDCRDLIFHVMEHRFTLPGIAEILESFGLVFVGFIDLNPLILKRYQKRFPQDKDMIRLELWDTFEQENPGTFANTYQFFVRQVD